MAWLARYEPAQTTLHFTFGSAVMMDFVKNWLHFAKRAGLAPYLVGTADAALMKFCAEHPPAKLAGSPITEVKTFDGVKYIAENGAWLMLRGSGTEPILRIYAEAGTDAKAKQLIQLGVQQTQKV